MGLKSFLRCLLARRWSLPLMSCANDDVRLDYFLQPNVDPMTPKSAIPITFLESCYRDGDTRLYECKITDVWLYKSSDLANHEYIVLNITYKNRDIGFLRVERTVDHSQRNTSSLSISSTSSTVSASSGSAILAHDIVTVYRTRDRNLMTKESEYIAHRFMDKPFGFAELVAACVVVNKEKPFYDLFKAQCYWFAGVVINLICDSEQLRKVPDAEFKQGEWQNFVAIMAAAKMDKATDALRPEYMAKLAQLRSRADGRVQQARRHAEEVHHEREQADLRVAEERRGREEAERRREEAERRREEAERQAELQVAEERRGREEETRRREDLERQLKALQQAKGL